MRILGFSLSSIVAMALLVTFIVSCETGKDQSESSIEATKPEKETAIEKGSEFAQYDIRYENKDGDFISINERQLKSFVINQFELDPKQEVDFVKIIKESGNEHIKVLLSNKLGNKSQFAVFIQSLNEGDYGDNAYLMEAKICACTSCLEGCELKVDNKRCACVCPSEEDPCTKTEKEIVEGNYKPSDFEG